MPIIWAVLRTPKSAGSVHFLPAFCLILIALLTSLVTGCAARKPVMVAPEEPLPRPCDLSAFDIPLVINEQVIEEIEKLSGPQIKDLYLRVRRSGLHEDRIRELLAEYGLPLDLVYMVYVESGFDPWAVSKSGVVAAYGAHRKTLRTDSGRVS